MKLIRHTDVVCFMCYSVNIFTLYHLKSNFSKRFSSRKRLIKPLKRSDRAEYQLLCTKMRLNV